MFGITYSTFLIVVAAIAAKAAPSEWISAPCTFHDYEGDQTRLGESYDNSPGWCGIRYSALNTARITAVSGLGESLCNACLEILPDGNSTSTKSTYVLAVDQKGAAGLDVARTSFQSTFPGSNPLDPQVCRYRVVDSSLCGGVCFGSAEECTAGKRCLLPANALPPIQKPGAANEAKKPTSATSYAVYPTTDAVNIPPTTKSGQPSATIYPTPTPSADNSDAKVVGQIVPITYQSTPVPKNQAYSAGQKLLVRGWTEGAVFVFMGMCLAAF
ncbi:hypothetical protein SpCBS45565_g07543 [Spizellomyces sp. 'palustris']|nr:hypothetical protein SpCBS45565_g07543 [Spizellomyces sp. 'palustris']